MFAVTQMTMTRHTTFLTMLFSTTITTLGACGGAAPVHNGYPSGENEPWSGAKKMKLTDNYEASGDGTLDFAKRERARWYVLELPAPGSISARMTMDARTTGADLGFEILDGGYNIVAQGQNDDDLGQEKKLREVKEARAGKTYFHIYALGRGDIADYKIRVKYEPKQTTVRTITPPADDGDPRSSFPWTVPNLPPLAAVPPSDDTPKAGRRPPKDDIDDPPPPPTEAPDPAAGAPVRGTIIEFSKSGSGVKITINKGGDAGVEEGWTGYVMNNATKRSLPKGSFKIKSVKSDESEGVTGLTLDQVQANRTVWLKPAK